MLAKHPLYLGATSPKLVEPVRFQLTTSRGEASALALSYDPKKLERVNGNDPSSERWQRPALPLSYTRKSAPGCLP